MATNKNQEEPGAASGEALAAETDARIAELEKKLAEANSKASAVDNLRDRLAELQNTVRLMQATGTESIAGATVDELKSEADMLKSVINDKRVKIRIATEEGEAGKAAVSVIVNGHLVYIPRGVESEIPNCAYQALMNATETRWETDEQGRPSKPDEVPRFNVTFLGFVETAE
jgi:vacuolar-type H+-ATPase subunit I/STV1